MRRRIIIRDIRYHAWVGMTIAFLITLPFCPWVWKPLVDAYSPYSGTVVDKGTEHHYFTGGDTGDTGDHYIILQDSRGARSKKYVSDIQYALIEVGSCVVKKRGFGQFPLRPRESDPRERWRKLDHRPPGRQN